jgi:hypothetical protein
MGEETPIDISSSSGAEWVKWLKQILPASNLEDATVQSLLHHLADLEIFSAVGDASWKLSSLSDAKAGSNSLQQEFLDHLKIISGTSRGFILGYFLGDSRPLSHALLENSSDVSEAGPKLDQVPAKSSSNLSNLQIVKKVGRQLQPFIELENKVTSRLLGKYTGKEDAQRIFHYVLSKEKSTPKKWEQLSRKRHK